MRVKGLGVLIVVLVLTFGLSMIADTFDGTKLWPPVAALLVILATRNALVGLLAGALSGAILLAGGNPWLALTEMVSSHLIPHFSSSWKQGAIAFTLLLGGFAGVLEAGGGFTRLVRRSAGKKNGHEARTLESASAGLGLLCFFDGLANSMVVGRVSRQLADRQGVARVKLAYIVDSTSSAVACLAFVSTWIAFQLSMIGESFALAGHEVNPYAIFLRSVPYNFYCWLTLVMMFLAIRLRFHPGPMASFVQQAEEGNSKDRQDASELNDGPIKTALIPLASLMLAFFVGFIALGSPRPIWPLAKEKIVAAFGSDAGPMVLVLAALVAGAVAVVLFPGRKTAAGQAFGRGFKTMIAPIFILVAAWMLGSVISDLGTASWLSGLATGSGKLFLLPSLVFLTGAVVSFSTGTSWGTMGLLFPLAVPASAGLGADQDFLVIIVAAVFSGAVFGDHCSPFSDTTIVSSISCGVTPHDHVRTQIPYALITAAAAVLLGFLPAGLGAPGWLMLVVGALGLYSIVRLTKTPG